MSDAQPITGCRPGDVTEHVFLCGDPGRVEQIASGWTETREVCNLREYRILRGLDEGMPVTVASTGIGAPSAAVLIEELAKLGSRTFIRVGSSGGLDPSLQLGELAITSASIRDDGTSASYVIPEYPAAAHHRVVAALEDAAVSLGVPHQVGVTWSFDAFYARNATATGPGEMASMSFGGYWPSHMEARIRDMQAARVMNCEMESGVLLTLAGLFGLRAGSICIVSDRTPWEGPAQIDFEANMGSCVQVARAAMRSLV
ncbi:MAG: nucleoside phosphorylase [Myxococcota bacterium]|nr:nucleoside phosphorylase [Myxococcota bacterium]